MHAETAHAFLTTATSDRSAEAATRDAFDLAAPVYDREYESLIGIQRLRSIIREQYLRYFLPNQQLLELNCGTASDAVLLARNGMRVLATDVSSGMIAEAEKKLHAEHLKHLLSTKVMSFHDVKSLKGRMFDGAYSNMGGLNCSNNLRLVAEGLADIVTPGGFFLATVMPDFCMWETTAFLARLQWRNAFRRRTRSGVQANLHGGTVRTYYYSPRTFAAAFAPHFKPIDLIGLNIFTPPPNSLQAYTMLRPVMRMLETVDNLIARLPVFSSLGDHYLMVLQRERI